MKIRLAAFYFTGFFLVFGVAMLLTSAFTLINPGTALDAIWQMNPKGHEQMLPYGMAIGIAFTLLAIVFAIAIAGWFKRRKWGWAIVVGIFVANGIGDATRIASGDLSGGLLGICVASVIVFYLTRPLFRQLFAKT
ncbi:MAG TPA: hypothetical protein VG603_01915 [Chitinophagales bacterium]|nr:hypothetical protein [Chitinophagales bacterium]